LIRQVLITMMRDEMTESSKQFRQRQRLGENDSSVRPALPLPSMSQRDEVSAIERDKHPPFGGGYCQLLFIRDAEVPCISHGETIDSVGPEKWSEDDRDVLVEVESHAAQRLRMANICL
jgi:hypothetical protein